MFQTDEAKIGPPSVGRQITSQASTSVQVTEPQRKSSVLCLTSLPAPDLTPCITKADAQYVAGGCFGDVYRCWYDDGSPREVAVKAFRFRFEMDGDDKGKHAKMHHRELGIWKRLDHINIVPFLGIAYGFGMSGAMSLVSSWMPNESLHRFLMKYGHNLGLEHQFRLLLDVANGLKYLHSFSIVHGDLNSNNVLIDANCTARLADFGYASLVGDIPEALTYLQRTTARPGALRWIAPEQVDAEETFVRTTKSDVYSFGCVALQGSSLNRIARSMLMFLQVLSGKQPWSEVYQDATVVLRLAKGRKPGRPTSRAIDDSHWNMIQDCWSSVEERPTPEAIIFTIQQFLSQCSQSPPLRDLVASWKSHAVVGANISYNGIEPSANTAQ